MWIVRVALSRPYTFVVLALLILLVSPLAILRTPTDIFPNIGIPVVSIIWNYDGFAPRDIADRIVTLTERGITTTVNDIEHIESQSYNGVAVVKLFFRPSVTISTALAQVAAVSQTQLRQLPPGTNPPLVVSYSASTVPVLQLGLSGTRLTEQQLYDLGVNTIRTQLATVQGAAVPFPFGGKQRLVSVDIDTSALQAKGLSPTDVVNAVSAQNLILPSGTAKLGPLEYHVEMNGSTQTINELNDLPVRTTNGATIYLRDVAHVRDGYSPQTNIVRQDGRRSALLSIYKTGSASTLAIVHDVRTALAEMAGSLPPELKITPMFDQSIFVRAAVQGVIREALTAACLTAAMILLFLGNWRSTLIIAISIPLSILVSVCCLSALGETMNLMTLGGLALAVGILVDDATVEIENIERNRLLGKEIREAILHGAQEIAVPALVSTLCICIVFVPMFFLSGVTRFLFVPLAEAVIFAMLASYLLSRTLVPTMVLYLLRHHRHGSHGWFGRFHQRFEDAFERLRDSYRTALSACMRNGRWFAAGFLILCVGSLGLIFLLGEDLFPQVDAGLMRLHVRARTGLRIEETARLTDQVENAIRGMLPAAELDTILDNIGLPYSGLNLSYSNAGTIGTPDAEILISLKPDEHRPTAEYVKLLRETLPRRFPGTQFSFQPADIVTQILNFGVPAPIDIQVVGNNQAGNYELAQRLANRIRQVQGAVDVHVQQAYDSPTLHLDVDRTFAQSVGLSQRDVAQNLLVSLSSSFQTAPTFWLNPKSGISYNVAAQTPQYRVDSIQALLATPVRAPASTQPQILGNLASFHRVNQPAVVSHRNIQPLIDVYASVQGRDLGGVARDVSRITQSFQKQLPKGSHIAISGQVSTMSESFIGLGAGVAMAIVLAYFLIVVNFQSWLDPFIILTALPGALAGITWALLLTHTTLNVPSLTGAIMCVGVATANSILMVSFARQRMEDGLPAREAAIQAGHTRMRPVLMTALAMIIGMAPMAVGLGEGGEQNAPLGRAVIGGLLFATVATLFFVPVVFGLIHGAREQREEVE
ncbi:MAG TPA: efflux RND transporter permease subunit [Bryobacteraceae bacterium]|nr:efflux RND transporter permease subunit [Bryobacteraceae bacterium]